MNKDNDILLDSIDERIESFLRGTMSEEEETEFKQEIKDNPELRNRAMAMTSLIRGLQAKNTAIEETIIKENTTKSRKRSILWWACSIAAVLVIFFGINSLGPQAQKCIPNFEHTTINEFATLLRASPKNVSFLPRISPKHQRGAGCLCPRGIVPQTLPPCASLCAYRDQ